MIASRRAALVGFASWLDVLFQFYFRSRAVSVLESLSVRIAWLVVNLLLDYPMCSHGPMKMRGWAYYSEIGLNCLTFPAFGFWASRLARQ
jgi:hypothetical protein